MPHLWLIGNPRPVLRTLSRSRMTALGVVTTALKSRKSASGVVPGGSPRPSSMTEKVTTPRAAATTTWMLVADADEYLIAFVRPFSRIWRSLVPSVIICGTATINNDMFFNDKILCDDAAWRPGYSVCTSVPTLSWGQYGHMCNARLHSQPSSAALRQ
jgi:hypothetical protein